MKKLYKMRDTNSNSGVFIRIPIKPHEEWMPVFYANVLCLTEKKTMDE